jgi:hypothetical protein
MLPDEEHQIVRGKRHDDGATQEKMVKHIEEKDLIDKPDDRSVFR